MSTTDDTRRRLERLEAILAESHDAPATGRGPIDECSEHLAGFPAERLSRVTAELRSRSIGGNSVDAVAHQILLNDYIVAVGHLRAVARRADVQVRKATAELAASRRTIKKAIKDGAI